VFDHVFPISIPSCFWRPSVFGSRNARLTVDGKVRNNPALVQKAETLSTTVLQVSGCTLREAVLY